jgi:hypothetical protein
LYCESGYSYGGVCSDLLFLGTKDNYTIPADGACNYNYTALHQTIKIGDGIGECAWDGSFKKYCSILGTNSELFQEYKKKIRDWYFNGALKVHSIRRATAPQEIFNLFSKINNFPHLINADKCALNLFGISSNGAMIKLSFFALIGLFLFFF